MSLQEMSEKTFLSLGKLHRREALFFFTPLCGTCKLAEGMLETAVALGGTVPLNKININFSPELREKWQIKSVPALVVLDNGEPVSFTYAMGSAAEMYMQIRQPQ